MNMAETKTAINTDLLIAGGGSAGCAAAVAAARRGRRVLLVEEANCLGGVSTSGGVSGWFASLDGLGDIFDRVVAEMDRFGARSGQHYNPEYLKLVWQLMAQEAGVEILLHTSVTDADVAEGRVTRVSLTSCSRPLEVEAEFFIDTTGEGDLAALAGAEYQQGDPESGLALHMSLTAIMMDTGRPVTPYLPEGIAPIADDGSDLPGLRWGLLPDGRLYMNSTKVMRRDPTDPWDLTAAELEARIQLARVAHYIQRMQHPTFALVSSGATIGIREGRRIIGDYVLTEQDITGDTPRDFEDGVTVGTSQIDFHSLTEPGRAGRRDRVEPYAIPFRCMVARGFSNLLMAGKCISADQVAHSSTRMTPTCVGMGQAAGTAAAMAVENGFDDIRQISITELRADLAAHSVELDPRNHKPFPQ